MRGEKPLPKGLGTKQTIHKELAAPASRERSALAALVA